MKRSFFKQPAGSESAQPSAENAAEHEEAVESDSERAPAEAMEPEHAEITPPKAQTNTTASAPMTTRAQPTAVSESSVPASTQSLAPKAPVAVAEEENESAAGRIWWLTTTLERAKSNPATLVMWAAGAVFFGVAVYRIVGGHAEPEPALARPAMSAVQGVAFPEPNFQEARRIAVTDADVAKLLERNAQRAANTAAQAGAVSATHLTGPEGQRLYTAHEVAAAIAIARSMESEPGAQQHTAHPRPRRPRGSGSSPDRQRPLLASNTTDGAVSAGGASPSDISVLSGGNDLSFYGIVPTQPLGGGGQGTAGQGRLSFGIGTRIPAVLEMGISSSHHGMVLARTMAELRATSGQRLPAGTLFRGSSSGGNDGRVFVEFNRIVVDGQPLLVQAVAAVNQQAGIPAVARQTATEDRARSRLATGAIEALKGVASVAGGAIGAGLAAGTEGALTETQQDFAIDRSMTFEVAPGTEFQIVVVDG